MVLTAIFYRDMEYFLSPEEKLTGEIISRLISRWETKQPESKLLGSNHLIPGEEKEVLKLLREEVGKEIISWMVPRQKKDFRLGLYLLNQLAACFPSLALKLAVHFYLFSRILILAGYKKEEFLSWLSGPESNSSFDFSWGSHLFLPPGFIFESLFSSDILPVKKYFLERKTSPRFLIFPLIEAKAVLVPEFKNQTAAEVKNINYFLLNKDHWHLLNPPAAPGIFPLRPLIAEIGKANSIHLELPVFSIEKALAKNLLADFFAILTGCFCGWSQAVWRDFIYLRPDGIKSSQLEKEASVVLAENQKIKYYLSRLLTISSSDYPYQVARLSRQGLKLASRAWAFYRQIHRPIKPAKRR